MKKSTRLSRRLTLSTETLRTLTSDDMTWAAGGLAAGAFDTRASNCPGECGTMRPCTSVIGCNTKTQVR